MTILTYGYSRCRKRELPPGAVNIARWTPEWVNDDQILQAPKLAPSQHVWKLSKDGGDWKAEYMRQLGGLFKSGQLGTVLHGLPDRAVLMCWEPDPNDCHRVLAARFMVDTFSPHVLYGGEWSRHNDREPTLFEPARE